MEFLSVFAAALAAFIAGSVWYMLLAEPWKKAAKVSPEKAEKYEDGMSLKVFGLSFVLQLLVAGMMRHVFSLSGIESAGAGIIAGIGVGLFFISPWIAINNLYAMRPMRLTLIDGGYATLACAIMGLILTIV